MLVKLVKVVTVVSGKGRLDAPLHDIPAMPAVRHQIRAGAIQTTNSAFPFVTIVAQGARRLLEDIHGVVRHDEVTARRAPGRHAGAFAAQT